MPEHRDRDDERDDLDEDERDDEDGSEQEDRDEDEDSDESPTPSEPDAEQKAEEEAEARRRAAARKKAAERKKAGEGRKVGGERVGKGKRRDEERRPGRREAGERAVPSGRKKKAPAPKRGVRAVEPVGEIREPDSPPHPEVDLSAPLEPEWETGVVASGSLVLSGAALALVSVLFSSTAPSPIRVAALGLLVVAMVAGGFGILARRSWGYVLGMAATGVGGATALLWTLYGVVTPDISPWIPLLWLLVSSLGLVTLFWMRWGPGPRASELERLRSLKRRMSAYTTMHGELAYAGAVAALLGSLLALGMLLGAGGSARAASPVARFAEGMALEPVAEAPERGTLVLARWGAEVYFFLGRAGDRRGADEVHISYLDGDQEWVRLSDLRRDTIRAGSVVHAHVQGHEGWLPAQVTQRTGDRVEVDLGSQRTWVPLAMVRVREL